MSDARIPVTLLTGFLGAGKTTLLNSLLRNEVGPRIAVIVNEFGEAGLDHDLIETASDEIVLMESGCLCCTVRGELADTITNLFARKAAGDFDFDRIVIETTGLADPGPILQTMLVERALATGTRMDGVVTVVDAANGATTLDAQFEAVSQVAMADLIVLSKTDLAAENENASIENRLRSINATAQIVRSTKGSDIGARLWGVSALRADIHPDQARSWVAPSANSVAKEVSLEANVDPLANLSGLGSKSTAPKAFTPHDTRIQTASFVLDGPLSDKAFDNWLNALVLKRGPDLLRVKGIVFLEGIKDPFVFHGVQQIFNPPVQVRDWPQDDQRSRIVVIARDIPQSEIQRSFDMLRPKANSMKEVCQ